MENHLSLAKWKNEVYQPLENGNIDRILSTRHQFLLQKLYVEEDIGISLFVSSISWIYAINYHLTTVYIFKHA